MAFESLFDFVVVVIGTYIGATAALRGFFGRKDIDLSSAKLVDETRASDECTED